MGATGLYETFYDKIVLICTRINPKAFEIGHCLIFFVITLKIFGFDYLLRSVKKKFQA